MTVYYNKSCTYYNIIHIIRTTATYVVYIRISYVIQGYNCLHLRSQTVSEYIHHITTLRHPMTLVSAAINTVHICDHPWEKGVWVKFSKMRFLLFCNHYTFILQIFCIWVVIAILVINYSMLKSLPVNVRINKKPEVACFH